MDPILMKTIRGASVEGANSWECFRRDEILHLFQHYVYGERPVERPKKLEFSSLARENGVSESETSNGVPMGTGSAVLPSSISAGVPV